MTKLALLSLILFLADSPAEPTDGLAAHDKGRSAIGQKWIPANASPRQRFRAQLQMLDLYYDHGDAKQLAALLSEVVPADVHMGRTLADLTVDSYADVIARKVSVSEAVRILDLVMSRLPEVDHEAAAIQVLERVKTLDLRLPRNQPSASDAERLAAFEKMSRDSHQRSKFRFVAKKAELLSFSGRTAEAVALTREFLGTLPTEARLLQSGLPFLRRLEAIGRPTEGIGFEKARGEFESLASLKGKVVVIEFSENPGRTLWSYGEPRLRKIYSEWRSKGLEFISVIDLAGLKRGYPKVAQEIAERRVREADVAWPIVFGDTRSLDAFAVEHTPQMAIVDRKGNLRVIAIRDAYSATREYEKFVQRIEQLLAEPYSTARQRHNLATL